MGTWNNLQEGFTVNERLPDTLVDVAICNVYFSVANIHRKCRAARYSGIHSSHYFGLKQLCFAGLM